MALTVKQKLFADEYLTDLNATRAYKAVYKNCKKDETAKAAGSRLLTYVNVEKYVEKRIKDREKRTEITQDKVLSELAKIGFANIGDYLSYRTALGVIDYNEDGEPVINARTFLELVDSKEVDTSVIQEVSISKDGTFKFKLYDKEKALEQIGRHLGMFKDKVEVSGSVDVNNPFAELTTEELRKLINSG